MSTWKASADCRYQTRSVVWKHDIRKLLLSIFNCKSLEYLVPSEFDREEEEHDFEYSEIESLTINVKSDCWRDSQIDYGGQDMVYSAPRTDLVRQITLGMFVYSTLLLDYNPKQSNLTYIWVVFGDRLEINLFRVTDHMNHSVRIQIINMLNPVSTVDNLLSNVVTSAAAFHATDCSNPTCTIHSWRFRCIEHIQRRRKSATRKARRRISFLVMDDTWTW